MEALDKFIKRIPSSAANTISIVSSIITIISIIQCLIAAIIDWDWLNYSVYFLCVCIMVTFFILVLKFRKYRSLSKARLDVHSEQMNLATKTVVETLFKLLLKFKKNELSKELLTNIVKTCLRSLLDSLEEVFKLNTGRNVDACIKLILYDEDFTEDNASVKTFVRSEKSAIRRNSVDINNPKPVLLRDNTDFDCIFNENMSCFYQGDLPEYEKNLRKADKIYKNTNPRWKDYYRGTVVVPIRMQNEFLHFTSQNDYYQIIGFLCIDSLDTDAFLLRQKESNTAFLEAYAWLMYIILSKYEHYLSRLN